METSGKIFLSTDAASTPFKFGMEKSMRIKLGLSSIAFSIACAPSSASQTLGCDNRFRRAAKLLVKVPGMCWVMTVGGQLAGNSESTAISASTPPVEAPIATTLRHRFPRSIPRIPSTLELALRLALENGCLSQPPMGLCNAAHSLSECEKLTTANRNHASQGIERTDK